MVSQNQTERPAQSGPAETGNRIAGSRIEAAFQRWGYFVVRHRWMAIVAPLLLTSYCISWLPQLSIDNSTEAFLLPEDPASVRYREFRDRFDRDDRIIIALSPRDIFDPSFLETLRLFHREIEAELPYVQDVTSLFNARSTRGEGDELIVEDLLEGWLEKWPDDVSGLEGMRERVLANPLFVNTLVSQDARLTTVTIKPFTYSAIGDGDALSGFDADGAAEAAELLTAAENDELLSVLRGVIARYESPEFPIHLGGPLAVTDQINRFMERDMGVFMGLSLLLMAALLYLLFRRISGAVLPLMVVGLAVLCAVGLMIILDIPGSTAVQILPVFLLAVGVCDAVHILTIVYQRLQVGDAKVDAIAYAVGHSGLAVVMTSLTTAAGMMSFITAEMVPVRNLGVIAPIGVMLALAYTLLLLPALLAVSPLRAPRPRTGRSPGERLTRVLVSIGDFSADHPAAVLSAAAVVVAVSIAGATQARFSHLALEWFQADDPMRIAAEILDRDLRGSMSLEVLLDSGRENGLHDPTLLRRVEAGMRYAEGVSTEEVFVGKAISLVDIVKETHQALNENRSEYYTLPDSRELIAQELLLFENGGAEDLEEIVDTQFQTARISLRAPFVDAMLYQPFIDEVEAGLREILGDDVEIEMTGFMPVLAGVISAVIVSMGRSYVFALVVITPMMMMLLGSLRLGLVSMIPNLIPVLFTLGLMGWLSFPLDATTIMIGAMVIGVAVDDTIHFMHKFRLYYAESGDSKLAIRETLTTTGSALLYTSLVLAGGFFVLTFASMVNTQRFGLLAASATLVAFAADVVVAPALMTLVTRWKEVRP